MRIGRYTLSLKIEYGKSQYQNRLFLLSTVECSNRVSFLSNVVDY